MKIMVQVNHEIVQLICDGDNLERSKYKELKADDIKAWYEHVEE
jgi:hypothetical protein